METLSTYWLWIIFGAVIMFMLALDLGLFNRKPHTPTYRESLVWSLVWVTLAMCFAGVVFWQKGETKGFEFLAGYLIELSLSVDNLFVFLLIFTYFKVPARFQHRVLFWGVFGALVMRVIMIFLGTALIERFHWLIYVFGFFLVYTGLKMFGDEDDEIEPEENPVVKFVTRFIPIDRHYDEQKFFTVKDGKTVGTLLLLVLVIVEVTDLIFAVDSIPAIFGVTTDRFIVYTSNVFAIMGLRTFFFLLAGVIEKFHYLKVGLACVLTFIGVKMVLPLLAKGVALLLPQYAETIEPYNHIPIKASLMVVAFLLASSIAASVVFPKSEDLDVDIDLPPEYDGPFDEEEEKVI
jgi:tellurite resistance protein TerC